MIKCLFTLGIYAGDQPPAISNKTFAVDAGSDLIIDVAQYVTGVDTNNLFLYS